MYLARFLAAKDKNGNIEIKGQLLKQHLNHVSRLAEHFGKKVRLSNFMRLAGLLHDMGKYSAEFQKYIKEESERAYLGDIAKKSSHIDHGVYGAKFIYEKYAGSDAINRMTAEILMVICCCHHGGLPDCTNKVGALTVINRIESIALSQLEAVLALFNKEIAIDLEELFTMAKNEMECALQVLTANGKKECFFYFNLIVKLVYSMLVDADRLDSMCFELGEQEWEKYLEDPDFDEHLTTYQKNLEQYMQQISERNVENEGMLKVNQVRQEILDECRKKANEKGGIYDLTVPTGGGKTLSSMAFALDHNRVNHKGRIIYVIPFCTIIEQNAEVFREALGNECDLLEHHSNVIDENKAEDYKLLSTRWSNDIIVTTMVQFLNSLYGRGTQDIRRLHNLAGSTIIFDEIQTLSLKCLNLFNSAINFLSSVLNTTIVLCTATQPDLNSRYICEVDKKQIINEVDQKFQVLKRVAVINNCTRKKYTLDETVDYVLEKKQPVRSLLVVLNKVNSAVKVFRALQKKTDHTIRIFYLSSRLAPQHRKDVLQLLREALENRESLICVSTAVIEAGVDISFEAAIRNITKLDSIAQTAGRVNRNGENKQGFCYVINYDEGTYSNLMEIEIGAIHSRDIMEEYDDILMPNAMSAYFQNFYASGDNSCKFNYPVDNTSIYDLLTRGNHNLIGSAADCPIIICQIQFKEAAEKFEVIDADMVSLIVPYVNGKSIIDQMQAMNAYTPMKDRKNVLELAKPYTAGVYRNAIKGLLDQGAIYSNEALGVYILSEGYYDNQLGVVYEAQGENFVF